MALPRAVQQQVEEAERIEAQLANPASEPAPEPPQAPETEPKQDGQAQNEGVITQEAVVEPPAEPKAPDWKHKFESLQGKYNAEVPRLHAQLRDMGQQLQTLQAKLEQVATQPPPQAPQTPLVTDSDREAFGPDLVDLIERVTASKAAEFAAEKAALEQKIAKLEGQLSTVSERQGVSDQDRFWATLAAQVPDWAEINQNEAFLAWLNEVDPVYGLPRQAALDSAGANLDAVRAAAVFNAFKALQAPPKPAAKPANDLQRQVAPTRSRAQSAPADAGQEKQIYTAAQIEHFYDQWRRGHISDEDAVRIDADINAAVAEGRIR